MNLFFRLTIPFGFLGYTNSLGLWNVAVGSSDAETTLSNQRATLDKYANKLKRSIESTLDFKFPPLTYDFDLKQYWNCGVYMTFNRLANLDAVKLFDKSFKSINDLIQSQPNDANKPLDKK